MELSIKQVQPGMVIGLDVRDRTGRVLVAAGSTLDSHKIKMLKAWGIIGIDVQGEKTELAPPIDLQAWMAEALQRIDAADQQHVLITKLLPLFARRLAGEAK